MRIGIQADSALEDTMTKKYSATLNPYVEAAQSKATAKSYALDLTDFIKSGGQIPATPEMIADYLVSLAETHAVATIQHRLVAIHKAHQEKRYESPVRDLLVRRTMQGIRRVKGVAQRRVRALVRDDVVELLLVIGKQAPLRAARDKALLLIGFAGAFRRSELVALTVDDVTTHAHGIDLLIRRSKTDQEGRGRTVFIPHSASEDRCPVLALDAWLRLAGITRGFLFRSVSRHEKVGDSGLSPQSVALVVKSLVGSARGPAAAADVSSHSLRAGFITEAATVGLPTHLIMGVSGHSSLEMIMRYTRVAQKRTIPSLL